MLFINTVPIYIYEIILVKNYSFVDTNYSDHMLAMNKNCLFGNKKCFIE